MGDYELFDNPTGLKMPRDLVVAFLEVPISYNWVTLARHGFQNLGSQDGTFDMWFSENNPSPHYEKAGDVATAVCCRKL